MGCQLLLITNRKSHTGFRLIPTSMTLNGVRALIFRFFKPNLIAVLASYITMVKDIPVDPLMSVYYCLPVPVFHFPPCSAVFLSAIAELLHLLNFSRLHDWQHGIEIVIIFMQCYMSQTILALTLNKYEKHSSMTIIANIRNVAWQTFEKVIIVE